MNAYLLIQSVMAQCFNRSARFGWVGCLTLWVALGGWDRVSTHGTTAFAQSLGEAPQATLGALLLKNDRVLLGRIERQGDAFMVRIADDSQVSIPKAQTQFLGRNIEDIYAYKRQSLTNPTTGDHFKLTRWCMANQLLDQAVNHYQIVAKDAGDHPRVKQLAVELRNQLLEVDDFRSYLGLPPVARQIAASQAFQNVPSTSTGALAAARSADRQVVAASHKLESPPHPQVVERFGERVQPLLISRCSQAACHGGQAENRLRLINPNSKFFAQTSADNLASVLPFTQPDANEVVPLLAYATQAHGLQRQPGVAITEASVVAELQAWVELVHNPVVTAVAVAAAPAPGLRPIPGGLLPVDRDTGQLKQVPRGDALPSFSNPAPGTPAPGSPFSGSPFSGSPAAGNIQFPPGLDPPSLGELDALERQFNQLRPASPGTSNLPDASTRRDPFDPAEFNRRVSQPTADR